MERAITIGGRLIVVWLIALSSFMNNGQSHVFYITVVEMMLTLPLILSRALAKFKYQVICIYYHFNSPIFSQ